MGKKQIGSAGPPYEFNPETKFSIIDLKNTLNNLIELEKTIESDEIKYNINYKTNLDSSEKQSEYANIDDLVEYNIYTTLYEFIYNKMKEIQTRKKAIITLKRKEEEEQNRKDIGFNTQQYGLPFRVGGTVKITFYKDGKKVTRVVQLNKRGTKCVKYNKELIPISKLKIRP